jgi:hypothetical protein
MPDLSLILGFIRDRLEEVLQAARRQPEQWVVLTNPVELDGSPTPGINNKIVISMVSLQHDAVTGTFVAASLGKGDNYPTTSAPLSLDVFFLLTAHFTGANYPAGLAMMSRAIAYFQATPVITAADAPNFPPDIDRMTIEFVSLDFAEANHLLMLTGVKSFAYALYRVRRLAFSGQAITGVAPIVRAPAPAAGPIAA